MAPQVKPSGDAFARTLALGGDGPRVAVKDTIDVSGFPTMAGSKAFEAAPPAQQHAEVVERLLRAGCRIIGKTKLHELAFGVTGINDWTGTPDNPRFPGIIPGGSSSGSAAAVAAGLADFAIGTDTGGSIRIPAACCGIFGFKPTFGRVSRKGVTPAISSLDCVGPMAADIDWLIRGMGIIDPTFEPGTVHNPVIGLLEVEADDVVAEAVSATVLKSGLTVRPVSLPLMRDAFAAGITLINAENWAAFGHLVGMGLLGADIDRRLGAARAVEGRDIAEAERIRAAFRKQTDAALRHVDVLVLPTLASLPPLVEEARADPTAVNLTGLVRPFNLSGHPVVSMPLEPINNRPIALQVVGRHGQDEAVLEATRSLSISTQ